MIDGEQADLKDTNMGGVGSDEDKALRKAAAQTEPAWEGCGSAPGIEIWRIEYFQVVPIEKDTYGQFHKGDSYIVLHTQGKDDGALFYTIYLYIGKESSVDEKGTAAYKTVELDDYFDGQPTQVRVKMGEEPAEFTALFSGGVSYLDGGVESGFKRVVPEGYDPKLLQVRRVHGKTTTLQVPLQKKMINDSDSFVLDAKDKIYVYDGKKASPFEKNAANLAAENIENERCQQAKTTHDIDDGFWALLQ